MIDLFAIFGKGGLVLWCFQGTSQFLTPSVNALIRDVFLLERGNISEYKYQNVTMKFKLDNEFELIYLVLYQSVIQLAYVDKLLNDVHLKFRDLYKNVLNDRQCLHALCGTNYFDEEFNDVFQSLLIQTQEANKKEAAQPKTMKDFKESTKSQKTVASMLIQPSATTKQTQKEITKPKNNNNVDKKPVQVEKENVQPTKEQQQQQETLTKNNVDDDEILKRREEFMKTKLAKPSTKVPTKISAADNKKKPKEKRNWNGPSDDASKQIDYSTPLSDSAMQNGNSHEEQKFVKQQRDFVGKMGGELRGLDTDEESDDIDDVEENDVVDKKKADVPKQKSGGGFSVFSAFRSLVGSKKLTIDDVQPALDKMKEHLIGKNVAADIADKVCQSLAVKLDGKVIGTFSGVTNTVKESLRESLVQLLSPKRRVDILRDILEAKKQNRPYCIVFCGVNGVGKSTNLAKITFWLNENNCKVLIAACDTFRAGAVEQLRTHTRHLNALHPGFVQLYEQGYGKDAAGVAAQAISFAAENGHNVVLVDTAGRMQDNEPLMRALAKLIRVNIPDLVLFVGEALVGNEAVDQLTKFNQALADHAGSGQAARLIDGIVLTKFDTIDDKVGAAISMTYITGQPIVFVGTGQTYGDLKNLNANAVVHALLK